MKKFSFIIPVYQTSKYISQCIDSILNQSFKDFEIILIDDGSDDGSEKICDHYARIDNRVNVIHKKNEGQGIARNIGVKKAKGQYIIFVDSDDYWLESKSLMKINEVIDLYDIVFFDLVFSYNNRTITFGITDKLLDQYKSGEDFLKDILTINHTFPWYPVLYVFKKKIWDDNGISFPGSTFFEDTETVYKIPLYAKKVKILKNNVYAYRRTRENSTTKKINIKLLIDHIYVCSRSIIYIERLNIDSKLKLLLLNNIACGYIDIMNHILLLRKDDLSKMFCIMKENNSILRYIRFGKQKYMRLIIDIFGLRFSAFVFSIIRLIRIKIKGCE